MPPEKSVTDSREGAAAGAGGELTGLLEAVRDGEPGALERLLPLIYEPLREAARRQLRRHRPGQTLNTTALVHEAYLKLVEKPAKGWNDRGHFLAVAATAMRHILIDYARHRGARKRGGDEHHVPFEDVDLGAELPLDGILAVDEVLSSLAEVDPRLARLAELKIFGGLTFEEAAPVLGLSLSTVKRDWLKARAFLHRALAGWR